MSDTPRTFQARLIIEAGDWRNEKDCTDYALKVAEELERELVSILESHRTLVHENMELKNELAELNEWKAGMKGIEDYYIVKEKLYVAETAADSWRKCAKRLAASLKSEMRGEDARYSETGRPCAESDLEEFNRLASKP